MGMRPWPRRIRRSARRPERPQRLGRDAEYRLQAGVSRQLRINGLLGVMGRYFDSAAGPSGGRRWSGQITLGGDVYEGIQAARLTFREDDEVHPGHGCWIGRWAEVPVSADGVTESLRLTS
jgi:hypothetical protein